MNTYEYIPFQFLLLSRSHPFIRMQGARSTIPPYHAMPCHCWSLLGDGNTNIYYTLCSRRFTFHIHWRSHIFWGAAQNRSLKIDAYTVQRKAYTVAVACVCVCKYYNITITTMCNVPIHTRLWDSPIDTFVHSDQVGIAHSRIPCLYLRSR